MKPIDIRAEAELDIIEAALWAVKCRRSSRPEAG
jgi:hypothetical protein